MLGQQVGAYRILSELGTGGMGVVYLAEDTRLNRRVALKFIRADLERTADADARLVREARAASALDHPNVATIYEIGEWQQRHFVAMAWYDGETLAQRLERGRPSISEAIGVLAQIADGLARAHAAGIVHRDLKPGNIMVTRDGVVKILDFGLAAYTSSDAATEARLTRAGSVMGTVAYMAPEQALGAHADARTDVWALGVIAYEMLAGERPFRGAHDLALLHAIQYEDAPDLKTLRPDVPEAIRAVVMAALRRAPAERPQTVEDVGRVLRAWKDDDAGTKAPGGIPVWRRPAVIALVVLMLLGGAVVAGLTIARQHRAQWARDVALPEAARLAEAERTVDAFDLVKQAEATVPGDARLAEIAALVARTVALRSEPAGATVSYKDYQHPEAAWRVVGVTPLDGVRVPAAYLRWRFEKPGFTVVELPRWSGAPGPFPDTTLIDAVLKASAQTPAGMVFVPATAEPFRLFLPGFDHLDGFGRMEEFWIDAREVTNADFKRFVDAGGYRRREFWLEPFTEGSRTIGWEEGMRRFVDTTGRPGPSTWTQEEFPAGEADFPVSGVSWYEASAYARFAGKQLPTAHHWARAAEPRAARWMVPLSNFGGRGPGPAASRSTLHNFGGHDMAGNVKEWTSTETHDGRRYILGGAWDDPAYAYNDPDARLPFDRARTFGFRCVMYPSPPAPSFLARLPHSTRDYRVLRPIPGELFENYRRAYGYDRHPLNARLIPGARESADWRREDVTITTASGAGDMRVFLFLPRRAAPPYETVVFIPGSNALRTRSFDQFPLMPFDYLVKSGRAVAFPELLGTFARETRLQDTTANESATYREHVIAWVRDASRTIDYLETRQDLALERLAFVGLSWGGRMGAIFPAIDRRVRVQVLQNGGFSLQAALPDVDQVNFASRVTIPTLMLNGTHDFYFPIESSQRPMYRAFGTPEALKQLKHFDGGHNIPRAELIKETLAWLDRFQGVPRAGGGS